MNLNHNPHQRTTIVIGILCVIAVCVFPPWFGESPGGMHSLTFALWNDWLLAPTQTYAVGVDLVRLTLSVVVIVLATGLIWYGMRDKKS